MFSGSFLAAPLWAAFILAEDPAVAAACLLGEYLTAECWFGPTLASLFDVVPKDRRGVLVCMYVCERERERERESVCVFLYAYVSVRVD